MQNHQAVIELHYEELYRYFYRLTKHREEAEDLVQDTFERWMVKSHLYKEQGQVRAFLFKIGTRLFLDRTRKKKLLKWLPLKEELLPAKEAESPDFILEGLPAFERSIMLLKYVHGYTYEEIGKMFQKSPGTIKSKIFYCKEHLRKELSLHE